MSAYLWLIIDWSSDLCSSDLDVRVVVERRDVLDDDPLWPHHYRAIGLRVLGDDVGHDAASVEAGSAPVLGSVEPGAEPEHHQDRQRGICHLWSPMGECNEEPGPHEHSAERGEHVEPVAGAVRRVEVREVGSDPTDCADPADGESCGGRPEDRKSVV